MLSDWMYIGIFMLLSLFLPAVAIVIAGILGPKTISHKELNLRMWNRNSRRDLGAV